MERRKKLGVNSDTFFFHTFRGKQNYRTTGYGKYCTFVLLNFRSIIPAPTIIIRKPSAQRRHSLDTTWTELDYTLDASVNVAASHLLSKRRISSKVSQSFSKRKKCSSSKFERHITSQTLQACLTFWFGHHALKTMSRQVNCYKQHSLKMLQVI